MKYSLLFLDEEIIINNTQPPFFNDLNLDKVIDYIILQRKEFDLKNYFYTKIDLKTTKYRNEIFNDLIKNNLWEKFSSFSYFLKRFEDKQIKEEKNIFEFVKKKNLFSYIKEYYQILEAFYIDFNMVEVSSVGLKYLKKYLKEIIFSKHKEDMFKRINEIEKMMQNINYHIMYDKGAIKVAKFDEKPNISKEILTLLDKVDTKSDVTYKYEKEVISEDLLNQIYKALAKFYPREFKIIDKFYNEYKNYTIDIISTLKIEIQFYVSYIIFMQKIKTLGLDFNIPTFNEEKIYVNGGYDLALAINHYLENKVVINNDFYFENKERLLIISGPNQGGKTTFARFFGQTFYLASLGLLVSGAQSNLFIINDIFTMFEVTEKADNLNGKLQMELLSLNSLMGKITTNSLVILNEVFSSTSLYDGNYLGKKIIDQLNKKNVYGVFVTFLDDLANYNETTVNMESSVLEENPEIRTLKIVRKNNRGLTYADSISKRNEVTYLDIIRRVKDER